MSQQISQKKHETVGRRLPVWFVVMLSVVMLGLSLWLWTTRPAVMPGELPLQINFRVDVNHADVMTLAGLPGLGMVTGQQIIDYREAHGRFDQPSDLTLVNGIGDGKLQQLKPWIICGQGVAAHVDPQSPQDSASKHVTSQNQLMPDAQKSGSPTGELPLEEDTSLPGDLTH